MDAMNDSRMICNTDPFGPVDTYMGFDITKKAEDEERCDYIFTSRNNITVSKYAVMPNIFNGHYASDHFPVLATISFNK